MIGLGFLIPLGVTLAMVGKNTRTWKGVFWLHGISQVLMSVMLAQQGLPISCPAIFIKACHCRWQGSSLASSEQ